MKAKKNKPLIFTVPVKKTGIVPVDVDHLQYGDLEMFRNSPMDPQAGLIYVNRKIGSKMPKDEFFSLGGFSKIQYVLLRPNAYGHVCFELTFEELTKLLKETKKRQRKFSNSNSFYVGLSPDVSILIKRDTKGKKK